MSIAIEELETERPDRVVRTKKGRAVTFKYMTPTPLDPEDPNSENISTNKMAYRLAAAGAPEATAVIGGADTLLKSALGEGFYLADAKPLNISLVLRPLLLAKRTVSFQAMASVAAARAIESITDQKIEILWPNDLIAKNKMLATVRADSLILHDNFVGYIILGVAFNIVPEWFTPRLSDIVAAVFNNESHDVRERLAEAFVNEFFSLYDSFNNDHSFMDDYRARSMVLGRKVKVPVGYTAVDIAKACDINDDGCLIVEFKDGKKKPIYSRSGVIIGNIKSQKVKLPKKGNVFAE